MTSQKDQIQALIAEIDSVLQKATSRLPWVMSGEMAQQRQVLERVRNYLVVLQQQLPIDRQRQDITYAMPIGYPPEFYPSDMSESRSLGVDAQQMMRTILQEMSYLRATVMQPMQADLENLQQRRELLTQELIHLESERQNQTVAQFSPNYFPNSQQFADELVQVLMSRLQESLSQQIGQALGTVQAQTLSYEGKPSTLGDPSLSVLANPQYEQLQVLRSRSDQMLVNLDSTLNVVFESLQRNIQAYQASLTQGLERMYSTGQQSEVAFKALIKELAQQLNQEASSYLLSLAQGQAAIDPKVANPANGEGVHRPPDLFAESTANPAIAPSPRLSFPYPGGSVLATDLSATDLSVTDRIGSAANPDNSLPSMPELDAALELWLRSADSGNFNVAELISNSLNVGIPLNESAPTQAEVDFSSLRDAEFLGFDFPVSQPGAQAGTDEDTTELNDTFNFLEGIDSQLNTPFTSPSPLAASLDNNSVEQDEFYQSLFGSATNNADDAEPDAIAFLNDLDLSPKAPHPKTAGSENELDNIDQLALADLTFESISSDLELPELFLEEAKTETTFITELPASLFDDISSVAQSLEPFPLSAEAESLLTDLDPFSSEPDSIRSLTDLFQDIPQELAQSIPVDPPAIASNWAAAQTTVPMANTPQLMPSDALTIGLPDSEYALEGREDQFTRAALDENLLPDAFHETGSVSFNLDEVTLNSLSEDLSNVEASKMWQSNDLATEDLAADDLADDDVPSLDEFALFLEDTQEIQPIEPFSDRSDLTSDRSTDLTIEEFGTLFDHAPDLIPPLLPTSAVRSSLPTPSLQETQSPAEPHTSDDLLPSPPPKTADDGASLFTLEGMDDLFGDAPNIAPNIAPDITPVSLPPAPQPLDLSDPALSSLGMQDLLNADFSSQSVSAESLPFTLEGMDDLFNDAPSVQVTPSSASRPTIKEISPFKPDYGQQPAEESILVELDPSNNELDPSNNLEPLDPLLIDALPLPPDLPNVASQANSSNMLNTVSLPEKPPDSLTDSPTSLGLDEAFESLLGKPTPLPPSTLDEQSKEKKKAL